MAKLSRFSTPLFNNTIQVKGVPSYVETIIFILIKLDNIIICLYILAIIGCQVTTTLTA